MSDPRFAYVVPAGTAFSDAPNGATRGVFAGDVGIAADGVLKHKSGAVLVAAGDASPVWIAESALHSAVLGEDATRWDVLAQQLATLDNAAAAVAGDEVAGDKSKTFKLSPAEVQQLLDSARSKGMDVTKTGENAYSIDTKTSSVKLDASYEPSTQTATITIDAPFYVPNDAVWSKLEPLLPSHVSADASSSSSSSTTQAASAPTSTTDAESHVSYLETAEQKIEAAWDKAKALDAAQKKRVKDAAAKAVATARDLARDVEEGTRNASEALHDRAVAVKEKLKATAKTIGVAWFAGGVATWLVIGGVLYLVFRDEGRRETAKQAATAALA